MGKKRTSHNFPPYILSDIGPLPSGLGYVLKTTGLAVSSTAMVPKHPLRQIISRTPICISVWSGTHDSVFYLDTLSCGHQVHSFPQNIEAGKKRHRCAICGESQLAIKFPPSSVPSPRKKRVA